MSGQQCTKLLCGLHSKMRQMPVKITSKDNQNKIKKLIENMLSLSERFTELKHKNTNEKAQLEKEIQKLDDEIDEEVYKLYCITEDEKKIIEESLK